MANINGNRYRAQLKKTISTLSQSGLMAQEQFGYDYAGATQGFNNIPATNDKPDTDYTFASIIKGTQKGTTYLGYNIVSSTNPVIKKYKIEKNNKFYRWVWQL